ncbi:hypothetical protein [Polycladidibacter stylochi]|uniref:hypothetical protein n=1 Tax=Polycladidibacter stylochi TaxID=1807766 RepID=UPI0008363200|nr:hypothetical protein [Pseudovibrio stylochi]
MSLKNNAILIALAFLAGCQSISLKDVQKGKVIPADHRVSVSKLITKRYSDTASAVDHSYVSRQIHLSSDEIGYCAKTQLGNVNYFMLIAVNKQNSQSSMSTPHQWCVSNNAALEWFKLNPKQKNKPTLARN